MPRHKLYIMLCAQFGSLDKRHPHQYSNCIMPRAILAKDHEVTYGLPTKRSKEVKQQPLNTALDVYQLILTSPAGI